MPHHPDSLMYPSVGKTSASTNTETPWDPTHLTPQHVEMIKQSVAGIPVSRIVYNFKRFGVKYSSRHIHRVLESPKGREFYSLYSAQFHNGTPGLTHHGALYAPEAFYTELDMMRNPLTGERHRLGAAQDLMDRVGPPKISREQVENKTPQTIVVNLLPSQLSSFFASPPTVEAETVPLLENPSSVNHDG